VQAGGSFSPSIARLTTGGYVIAWEHQPPFAVDPQRTDLCFQGYDASGARTPASGCISINRPDGASLIRAVARANGGFTIFWSEGFDASDPSRWHWLDYDANGQAAGAIQSGPPPIRLSAERLAGGGFVKLLDADPNRVGLFFQLYAADGTPTGPAKRVTDRPGGTFIGPGFVVGLTGGGFAVSWDQRDEPTSPSVDMTQTFSAGGTPLGDPVAVAPLTVGPINCDKEHVTGTCLPFQNLSGMTATDDGGYIVAWVEGNAPALAMQSPIYRATFARQFRGDGSPASSVVGRIGDDRLPGPIAAVSPEAFVLATTGYGSNGPEIDALRVSAQPLR
jgi:hypothetical protein